LIDISVDPLNQPIHILYILVLALCLKGAYILALLEVLL
jgi:hypothetical protein